MYMYNVLYTHVHVCILMSIYKYVHVLYMCCTCECYIFTYMYYVHVYVCQVQQIIFLAIGDDSQDICHDHLTPSTVVPPLVEDGDSMASTGHYEGPSPPDTIDESSQSQQLFDKEEVERNVGDSSDGVTDKERDGTTTGLTSNTSTVSDSVTLDSVPSGGASDDKDVHVPENSKNDKKKPDGGTSLGTGGGGGGEVKVNGIWHSLDLVAMICYGKLRQKCRGERVNNYLTLVTWYFIIIGDKYVLGRKLKELVYNG